MSVAAASFLFMRFPIFLPESYFIYASQVISTEPWGDKQIVIRCISWILVNAGVAEVKQFFLELLSSVYSVVLTECYCLIFSSYRRDHALLYDTF